MKVGDFTFVGREKDIRKQVIYYNNNIIVYHNTWRDNQEVKGFYAIVEGVGEVIKEMYHDDKITKEKVIDIANNYKEAGDDD